MAFILCGLLAEQAPGPPLIGNNIGFYAVFGGVLLLVLIPLILWRRRRPDKSDTRKDPG